MEKQKYEYMNTTALAFMGDSVFELYIREHVLDRGKVNVDVLHRDAVGFVRADAQAYAMKNLMGILSEEELGLVKRARNKKITSKPKNADPVIYKQATAFEALIGFLYLSQNTERMEEIISRSIDIIERKKEKANAGKESTK